MKRERSLARMERALVIMVLAAGVLVAGFGLVRLLVGDAPVQVVQR